MLPNHEQAYIPEPKLTRYLLSETHAVGKAKAKYIMEGDLFTPIGTTVRIRTVWVVESGDKRPRFVTAYPA